MQTPGFSGVTNARKLSTSRLHPYLTSPARKPASRAPSAADSVSGQMDARELRDEVVEMKREVNAMKKERDVAKARQVHSACECACTYIATCFITFAI